MHKFLLIFILLFFSKTAFSQPDSLLIGIDGLTCSMCSYSVESMLKSVPEVREVRLDLNANEAWIKLKEGSAPDLSSLLKKVYDAGFSARSLSVFLNAYKVEWHQTGLKYGVYSFIVPAGKAPDKEVIILKLLNADYFSKKGFKRFLKGKNDEIESQLTYNASFEY